MTLNLLGIAASFAAFSIGFLWGRARPPHKQLSNPQLRRALGRARMVIKELTALSGEIDDHLATHRQHMFLFEARLKDLSKISGRPPWDELSIEAENLLKPTLALASQIAHAYDGIRQQTHLLTALTEVRTDPLTGLRNRRALDESLHSRLAMLERYANPFAVAVFDIDHFKLVNDDHGHMEGDRILQQVAGVLEQSVRDTDLVMRFGGEEFVVVMPETLLDGANRFAERTRARIAEELSVTVSGGVAQARPDDTPQDLLSRADDAMYTAKAAGRNRVYTFAFPGAPTPIPRETSSSSIADETPNELRPAAPLEDSLDASLEVSLDHRVPAHQSS